MAIPQQHGTEGAGHEDDNGCLDEGGRVLWFERVHGVVTDFVLKLWVCQQGWFKKFPVCPASVVASVHRWKVVNLLTSAPGSRWLFMP